MWRHPKYYKELRKLRNKLDQAISDSPESRVRDSVRPGPGPKPQASSSRTMVPGKSFTVPEPRCSTKINELLGCFTWKAIWCGERRTLLLFVTLSSTVKKWPEVL